jgi:hypothetical protein
LSVSGRTNSTAAASSRRVPNSAAAVIILCLSLASVRGSAPDQPDGLRSLLDQLNAPEFQNRLAAERRLDQLGPDEIRQLIELAPGVESAEAATRILHSLDRHYASDDQEKSAAASDVLESFLQSKRAILAEEARWLLIRHWKRRQQFAVEALRGHGAQVVLPEAIERARRRNPRAPFGIPDANQIQVFLGSEWDGSEAGRRELDRLPGLAQQLALAGGGNRNGGRGVWARQGQGPPFVTVFLVTGHPLSPEAAGRLKGAFGASVQDRGETMLGITAFAGVAAGGCLIRAVIEHGSAANAGLEAGDLITHVQDFQIGSFDDLVEELRNYSAGETVTIGYTKQARRHPPGAPPANTMQVVLRSWSDYARAINAAAEADEVPPARQVE